MKIKAYSKAELRSLPDGAVLRTGYSGLRAVLNKSEPLWAVDYTRASGKIATRCLVPIMEEADYMVVSAERVFRFNNPDANTLAVFKMGYLPPKTERVPYRSTLGEYFYGIKWEELEGVMVMVEGRERPLIPDDLAEVITSSLHLTLTPAAAEACLRHGVGARYRRVRLIPGSGVKEPYCERDF